MIKRTKGRLLITLLVITGLAGTINDPSLSKQERKVAVNQLKDTKANLLKNVKGLSDAQANFKAAPERWSVKECVFHITLGENVLWTMFEATMKEPATPEKRSEVKFSDEEVVRMISDRSRKATAPEIIQPGKAPWTTMEEALTEFKSSRTAHLKYTKTTTEDLRNHIFPMPFGTLDGYQFLLFMAAHSTRHTKQIEEIKADPKFPTK